MQTLTAVDAATLLNGPVEFLRGSHRGGHLRLPYREGAQTEDPRLEALRGQGRQCPALLAPGDVAVFGPYVVHGSQPNESDQPRRAFVNGFAFPGANRKLYPGHAAGAGETVNLLPPVARERERGPEPEPGPEPGPEPEPELEGVEGGRGEWEDGGVPG